MREKEKENQKNPKEPKTTTNKKTPKTKPKNLDKKEI